MSFDNFISKKISEYLINSHFNFEDIQKINLICKNNKIGIIKINQLKFILLNNYLNKQKQKYNINNFMYNLLLSIKNIKLTFLSDSFLDKLFIRKNITTYTVHKIIMFDKLIGKKFANYYIKHLQNKYITPNNLDTNFNNLIAKIIGKKSIKNYPFLKLFNSNYNKFTIENVNGCSRQVIYLLAIYYGFIWFNKTINYDFPCGVRKSRLSDYIHNRDSDEFDYNLVKIKKFYSPEIFTRIGDKCYLNNDYYGWCDKDRVTHNDNITLIKI